jgi:integrase
MATKRGHNEGTVRFIPERNVWEARFTYIDTKTGDTKRKKFSAPSQHKALAKGRKWKEELDQGLMVDADKITMEQWLDIWIRDYVQSRVKIKTREKYAHEVKNYIKSAFGRVPVKKMTTPGVQKWVSELSATGGRKGKGLSACTVRNARRTLIMALDDAVKAGVILKNVAKNTKPPRLTKAPINPLTKEEADIFIAAAKAAIDPEDFKTEAAYMAIFLALHSGMRIGEVFGLKKDCVNFKKKTISVQRELIDTAHGMLLQEWAKTATSRRQILIPGFVMKELSAYLARQEDLIQTLGDKYDDQGFIIANSFGKPIHTSNFRSRCFNPIKQASQIEKEFTFHDLRHTHATLLLQAGVNAKVIQERLGHESVTLTLDTYSHLLPSMQETAVNALEKIFTGHSNNYKILIKKVFSMDRETAVQSALASIQQEGIHLPDDVLEIFEKIKKGDMETDQARALLYANINEWRKTNPEWFWQGDPVPDKNDPYCYAGTHVLINKLGIVHPGVLSVVEGFFSATRLIELYLADNLKNISG